jgi:hypothetical protein
MKSNLDQEIRETIKAIERISEQVREAREGSWWANYLAKWLKEYTMRLERLTQDSNITGAEF